MSHLLQMRGLKRYDALNMPEYLGSHLLQMRGLKRITCRLLWLLGKSHLLQMRGLKLGWTCCIWKRKRSHLLQMRGLKQFYITRRRHYRRRIFYRCVDWNKSYGPGVIACMVASFTDAGIETMRRHYIDVLRGSHLLQMRGLKHSFRENVKKDRSRIFYRCVDWNK